MSQSSDGANEPHDDAQADEHTDETRDTLEWEEAAAGFAERKSERREVEVEIPDMGVAVFVVRGLKEHEREEVENESVKMTAMRNTMLKHGIVEGPPGFKPEREDHLQQIPVSVKERLVDEIESIGKLETKTRESFR